MISKTKLPQVLLFVIFPLLLPAQYEGILKDPDVIWAAEMDITYNLRPPGDADSTRQNQIVFWKNYNPESTFPYRDGELLIEKMMVAACSGDWPAWQYEEAGRRLSKEEVAKQLTFGEEMYVVFDVETLKDSVVVGSSVRDFSTFIGIRAKQLLYFDVKKGEFGLFTSSIAPVRYKFDYFNANPDTWMGFHKSEYAPFWLKMQAFSKKAEKKKTKVDDSKVSWAARINTEDNSPVINDLHTLKVGKSPVMQVLLDRFHFDRHYKAFNTSGELIPFTIRDKIFLTRDTIQTIDPETSAITIIVTDKTVDADQISKLRLVEDWFWDDRKKRLIIRLAGFAPIRMKSFLNDYYSIDTPLFYRTKD